MRFQLAAKADRSAKATEGDPKITIELGEHRLQARYPDPGEMGLLFAALGGQNELLAQASLHEFLQALLPANDYRTIRTLMADGQLEAGDLFGGTATNDKSIIEYIIEETAARPTNPSIDSSESQTSGGRKSTGRVHSQESTPSD